MNKAIKRGLAALTVALTAFAVSGCGTGKATEQYNDAKRAGTNSAPATIIAFPDGFSSVAGKCDGPNYLYVIFKHDSAYGSVAVVPNDPRCK
jgi:hypothetical protein